MISLKGKLLSGTVIPLMAGVGALAMDISVANAAANPTAVTRTSPAANPAAIARPGPAPIRLAKCGAKKGCNPCGAKKGCGPCAAKGCSPCGAKGCNPCAGGGGVSAACVIPRLAKANPCAAAKSRSPCGAKKGCNPCGAKKGCNPCGAKKGANPCNPCGGAQPVEITSAEAKAAYECLLEEMQAAYAKSGDAIAKSYAKWKRFNTVSYVSATHGGRYVNNYANRKARSYGKYEKVKSMPAGSVLPKDSFQVLPNGKLAIGPLFIMEKMKRGFSKASGDWRYTLIMPNGQVVGTTAGAGAKAVKFCYQCHLEQSDNDSLLFIPEDLRAGK